MKIISLKISNALSFPFLEHFEQTENTIEFRKDLNILIGANGSGKSNMLEIIFKLLQVHFFEYYSIHDAAIHDTTAKPIRVNNDRSTQIQNTISKNKLSQAQDSLVQIEVIPDEGDIKNMLFIHDNKSELHSLLIKNCDNSVFFNETSAITEAEIKAISATTFKFKIHNFALNSRLLLEYLNQHDNISTKFFYNYLKYFNQIQTLLEYLNYY